MNDDRPGIRIGRSLPCRLRDNGFSAKSDGSAEQHGDDKRTILPPRCVLPDKFTLGNIETVWVRMARLLLSLTSATAKRSRTFLWRVLPAKPGRRFRKPAAGGCAGLRKMASFPDCTWAHTAASAASGPATASVLTSLTWEFHGADYLVGMEDVNGIEQAELHHAIVCLVSTGTAAGEEPGSGGSGLPPSGTGWCSCRSHRLAWPVAGGVSNAGGSAPPVMAGGLAFDGFAPAIVP